MPFSDMPEIRLPSTSRKEVTLMNPFPSKSTIKRIFFSPIDEKQIARTRERVQNDFNRMNIFNIR